MSLPLFNDIGKQARDLFEKNFHFGIVKLDIKSDLTGSLKCHGSQKFTMEDGKMAAELEGKYEYNGFTVKPKVTTSSIVSGEIKFERLKLDGFDLTASGLFSAREGKRNTSLGFVYKNPDYNVECTSIFNDPLLKSNGFAFKTNAVVNLFGWIFGASLTSDPSASKVLKTTVLGGFQDSRFSFFVNCDPQKHQVAGSVYNFVNSNIQTGLIYNLGGQSPVEVVKEASAGHLPSLAFCANYILNDGATIKARINTDYLVGLSYILRIKAGIIVTLCTELDAQKLKQGGHKLGLGIEFN